MYCCRNIELWKVCPIL
uniref:Uncharacterized protein n=1 Tax=Arundo donax TaxID=35708 RepID=A0A0A8XMT3_ARUDO